MRLRNSTGKRTITVRTAVGPISLGTDKAIEVEGLVRELEIRGEPSDTSLELVLPATAMVGALDDGTDDGTEPDVLRDGTDDGTEPDALRDGTDDGTEPDALRDGDDRTGSGRRRRSVELVNSTRAPLRFRIERTIPVGKALRIVGPPELFDVTEDDDGLCITLRSPRPVS